MQCYIKTFKPYTPLSALALAKFVTDAGLPSGVFNVITGDSEIIGKAFYEDFRIRKLSFTGLTSIGKILYQNSADTVNVYLWNWALTHLLLSLPIMI